mmetsp:Transcript_125932/g.362145  ORF Transcript_125932/g.362145 Transcript_125932/m.362145 type:complete len:270 (+) Transcript_125932:353-1162(+)
MAKRRLPRRPTMSRRRRWRDSPWTPPRRRRRLPNPAVWRSRCSPWPSSGCSSCPFCEQQADAAIDADAAEATAIVRLRAWMVARKARTAMKARRARGTKWTRRSKWTQKARGATRAKRARLAERARRPTARRMQGEGRQGSRMKARRTPITQGCRRAKRRKPSGARTTKSPKPRRASTQQWRSRSPLAEARAPNQMPAALLLPADHCLGARTSCHSQARWMPSHRRRISSAKLGWSTIRALTPCSRSVEKRKRTIGRGRKRSASSPRPS